MTESSVVSQESSSRLQVPPIIIRKDLHALIDPVKKMQLVTTYEEVIEGLKIYIWEKKLYDPHNPFKVCCKDDALGTVFGAKEFTVFDVKTFIQKMVTPIVNKISKDSPEASSTSVSDTLAKRKLDENVESIQKKVCPAGESTLSDSPMILHIPPSPLKCDNSSDSTDSMQGYETAYVKDTSDEVLSLADSAEFFSNSENIFAIEETYNLEYEVESSSDSYFSSSSSISDSEADIAADVALDAALLTLVCKTDSDIEFFADNSSDEDVEIPQSDHWKCTNCDVSNRPTTRYCCGCWEERPQWMPEKNVEVPKKKRKQRKSTTGKDEASFSKNVQGSQESSSSELTPEIKESSSQPSSDACSSCATCTCNTAQKLCIICCEKPANAGIVHGKISHQICCYKCARILQKRKKRCPLCRRTIASVVRNVTA